MCMFSTAKADAPQMPPEYAGQKAPTERDAAGAGKRAKDRMRARSSTLLAGASSPTSTDTAGKKVLLGQ